VTWSFTIPGQPPSGNHAYKIGKGYRRGGISYPKIIKTEEAAAYQQGVAMLVKTARPSGWEWSQDNMVVVEYRFYLWDDADCTNLIKVIEDGIFPALGINDSWALPRAMSKELVPKAEARVEVTIW
jgi:hypothetical protein